MQKVTAADTVGYCSRGGTPAYNQVHRDFQISSDFCANDPLKKERMLIALQNYILEIQ